MRDNFSGMYWVRKRVEHDELAEALRQAARREKKAEAQRKRRAAKREAKKS